MKRKTCLFFALLGFCQITYGQIITTIMGDGSIGYAGQGNGGPATVARTRGASGITVDGSGNIYICESYSNTVRKIDNSGVVNAFAGTGVAGFSGDGAQATDAKINFPIGVVVDKKGNVYFDDALNFRIRKVDPSGIISTVAGIGSAPFSGDGGPATAAGFGGGGTEMCIDVIGNIYFAAGNRIRKIDTYGIISTYAGNGLTGNTGDGGPATAATFGSRIGQISLDKSGNMYVATGGSTASAVIRKINATHTISTIAGTGPAGFSGDAGPATAARLSGNVYGVYPDNCGNVYIADYSNNRIRMVDGHGIISTVAGDGTGAYSGDGGPASAAKFHLPGVLYLYKNSLYLSDDSNYCVRYIHMDTCKSVLDVSSVNGKKLGVRIFPNPCSGMFTISGLSRTDEIAQIVMTNMLGIRVKEFTITTNKETELTTDLPSGVYMVSIITSEGRHVERVVVE